MDLKYHIFLFRHGETDWNKERRLQGQTDTSLSELGKSQSLKLKERILKENLDIVFCSDLKRTKETCDIIFGSKNAKIIHHKGLREIHLGDAQGILESDISSQFEEKAYIAWKSKEKQFDTFRFPNGETKIEAKERIIRTVFHLLEKYKKRKIGICSHGFVLSKLLDFLSPEQASNSKFENCELIDIQITELKWKGLFHPYSGYRS
ncbi:histidine phosphatase family protein [Leptospira sarikeiensis]|uniref:Histidine phosphatase family protein n=1 Tax=Leptospira sarikeiensis TaxID=2484943 RepID=A0A4R9JYU9_9LEPT|nr:histidine phosphatase family protein [Leptospira sarikeiensis]TGL58431.1 histidine phosphatase family protein [Leptospira sarikeiensis]